MRILYSGEKHYVARVIFCLTDDFLCSRASTTTAPPVPDPIKLIKRMTALEIALSSLQDECKTVAAKRTQAVQRVIESQCDTVRAVKDVSESHSNMPLNVVALYISSTGLDHLLTQRFS